MEYAIHIFKATELYPESHVDKSFIKSYDYDNDMNRYNYTFKANPMIFVRETDKDGYVRKNSKIITRIPLQECIHVDFKDFLPQRNLLEAPTSHDQEKPTEETLPVIGTQTELRQYDKTQLREKHDELTRKQNEVRAIMDDLNKAVRLIETELSEKRKMLYILETFMGINEEVHHIKEGTKADEILPITLFQQTLYMDEEVGIWKDGGLDFQNIDEFDAWICQNYDKFVREPKSICSFQVRRKMKEYDSNPFINALLNEGNFRTYFLIRNGENLYRIWSDVSIGPRLFPATEEYKNIYKEWESWSEERVKEKLKDAHESYIYGLIAIQGIIERTDILGYRFKGKVNLLKPGGYTTDDVHLVRDAEREHWISQREPWNEFIKKNRSTIKQGTRVVLTDHNWHVHTEDKWRVSPFRVSHGPSNYEVYEVAEEGPEKSYHSWKFKIYYHPGDRIWDYWKGARDRKRRVPFLLYSDELINFDEITAEDCDYYEKNRIEREHYLSVLPILHWIKTLKEKEQKLEAEFTRYIADHMGWAEKKYSIIQDAIKHWKLKNKWKRGLMKDDAKAVRMILKKLKRASVSGGANAKI